ncbi:MAG: LmeA family phospholipid-binding protein [Egibacteraceae bacterium]
MKKVLFGLVVLLAVAALAVELVAPQLASARIEERVQEQTAGALGVSARVGPFPVVTRLLATNEVPRLSVTIDEVVGQQLPVAAVRFELEGVSLDRDALLGGQVRVRAIDRGRVTAVLDPNVLTDALGVPVRIEDGQLVVEIAGTRRTLPLDVQGGAVRLPAGLPDIALPDILPCAPDETATGGDRIELSCTIDVPPPFLQ